MKGYLQYHEQEIIQWNQLWTLQRCFSCWNAHSWMNVILWFVRHVNCRIVMKQKHVCCQFYCLFSLIASRRVFSVLAQLEPVIFVSCGSYCCLIWNKLQTQNYFGISADSCNDSSYRFFGWYLGCGWWPCASIALSQFQTLIQSFIESLIQSLIALLVTKLWKNFTGSLWGISTFWQHWNLVAFRNRVNFLETHLALTFGMPNFSWIIIKTEPAETPISSAILETLIHLSCKIKSSMFMHISVKVACTAHSVTVMCNRLPTTIGLFAPKFLLHRRIENTYYEMQSCFYVSPDFSFLQWEILWQRFPRSSTCLLAAHSCSPKIASLRTLDAH